MRKRPQANRWRGILRASGAALILIILVIGGLLIASTLGAPKAHAPSVVPTPGAIRTPGTIAVPTSPVQTPLRTKTKTATSRPASPSASPTAHRDESGDGVFAQVRRALARSFFSRLRFSAHQ
jgi:hypothetical protein